MGLCNFCSLKITKRKAQMNNNKVIKRMSDFMGGTDIFVIPKNEKMPINIDKEFREKYLSSWMKEISSSCAC